MVNPTPNNQPPNNENNSSLIQKILQRLKHPSTLIIGVSTFVVGAIAYNGIIRLAEQKLPPIIEKELSKTLNRPVKIGKLQNLSLTGVEVDGFFIPTTDRENDRVDVQDIKINFNLLPVIFNRTLPVEVLLIEPEIYLAQEKDGSWIKPKLNTQPGKESITIDTKVKVEDGKVTLVPYQHRPILIPVTGNARYNPTKNKQVDYDFQTQFYAAIANIKGSTLLDGGKTNAKLLVKNLVLANLAPLIPNLPVSFNRGKLNADLNVDLPNLKDIYSSNIRGTVGLDTIEARSPQLSKPIQAESKLNFGGQNLKVADTKAKFGDFVARVAGNVNLKKGYDLDIDVLPFNIQEIAKNTAIKLPVDVDGNLQANLQLAGAIEQPKITGNISNSEIVRVDRTNFVEINTDFTADLDKFVLENLQLKPSAGGQISASGVLNTNIRNSIEKKQAIDFNQIPLVIDFQATLPTEKLVSPYYSLPAKVSIGTVNAQGKFAGTIAQPEAELKWSAPSVAARSLTNISGTGEAVIAGKNILVRNTKIKVDEGKIEVNGIGNLDTKKWQTTVATTALTLNPFLTQIQSKDLVINKLIAIEDGTIKLAGNLADSNLDNIDGVANLNLNIDRTQVAINSQLNSGNLKASLNTNNSLAINQFLPTLALPVALETAQVNLAGKIQPLLDFADNPNLNSLQANVDAKIAVADGIVNTKTKLANNLWQTDLVAANLNSSLLSRQLATQNSIQNLALPNLNAKINLSGNLDPLLRSNINSAIANAPAKLSAKRLSFAEIAQRHFVIEAKQISVRLGEQSLDATGKILVSKLTLDRKVSWDLGSDLNIQADTDLNSLSVISGQQIASKSGLLSQSLDLQGKGKFQGRFLGKKLLTASLSPGNLALNGNLNLQNLAFNNIVFDPILAGEVSAVSGKEISLDLQGEKDVIAASLAPCIDRQCLIPYLPTNLEFRQGEGTPNAILATGKRQGERFLLDVENFPLALLNLSPATQVGIIDPVGGAVTANLDVNLYNLDSKGDIKISQPAIGYIKAEEASADFAYNSKQKNAQINSASLKLDNSIYQLQGGLDLKTGAIDAKLDIPKAYIQDILNTFGWFDLQRLGELFTPPTYAKAKQVQPKSLGAANSSLTSQLNYLLEIDKRIQAIAAKKLAGDVPTQLDIKGAYAGGITVAGTIAKPKVNFQIKGNNWRWNTQNAFPAIVEPLGLIKQGTQDIPIKRLIIEGEFADHTVTIKPAEIQVGEATFSATGKYLVPQQTADISYSLDNLSLDRLRNFVQIPIDIAGSINTAGTVQGKTTNPEVLGKIAFIDGSLNARQLPEAIEGTYSYDNSRLKFNTTQPSFIQATASVPYPTQPKTNDRFDANIKLGTEAIALIEALTQGQVSWLGGDGEVNLQASGRMNTTGGFRLYDLAANGDAIFKDAVLQAKALPEKVQASGKVLFRDNLIEVEQIDGKFAESKLSVKGVLPILAPQANIANPLTIDIDKGEIDLDNLYKGGVNGKVLITGAAITPIIGGKINLVDGQAFIPSNQEKKSNDTVLAQAKQIKASKKSSIVPKLQDFQIVLDNFKVEQAPLFKIRLGGNLTLNGNADNPKNLRPKGTLQLERADVDLLSNQFYLLRSYNNVIVFDSVRGLLNPYIDIRLKTEVADLSNFRVASINENEIPEEITRSGRTQNLDVALSVNGQANQLLASLGQDTSNSCQVENEDEPLPGKAIYTQEQLQKLENCINLNALSDGSGFQLINAPIVKLASTPSRSEGEIISLLGNQFLALATQLQKGDQDKLINFAVSQFVIQPLSREALSFVGDKVNHVGKKVGLDYLRVYPVVQGIYKLNQSSLVDLTYDYGFEEVQLRYEWRF